MAISAKNSRWCSEASSRSVSIRVPGVPGYPAQLLLRALMKRCRASPASRQSFGLVGAHGLVEPGEPLALAGHEHRAALHRRLVDMQRDGDVAVAGVADGVVFVRWDQAAGAARAGVHAAGGAEMEAVAIALEQFVLDDLQFAVPDAFDAPQSGMVVDWRALARTPGHGDDAVAMLRAAIQLAARVVVFDRIVHAGGQFDVTVADHAAQHIAQGGGDGVLVARGDGGIDGCDQLVVAAEVEVGQRVGLMSLRYVHITHSSGPAACGRGTASRFWRAIPSGGPANGGAAQG